MINQKEIEAVGKEEYALWRQEKDKVNILKEKQNVFTGQEIKVAGVFDYFKTPEELDQQYDKDVEEYEREKDRKIKRAEDEQKRNIKEGRGKHNSKWELFPGGAQRDIDRAKNHVKNPPPKKPEGYDKRKLGKKAKQEADAKNKQQDALDIENEVQTWEYQDPNRFTPTETRKFYIEYKTSNADEQGLSFSDWLSKNK